MMVEAIPYSELSSIINRVRSKIQELKKGFQHASVILLEEVSKYRSEKSKSLEKALAIRVKFGKYHEAVLVLRAQPDGSSRWILLQSIKDKMDFAEWYIYVKNIRIDSAQKFTSFNEVTTYTKNFNLAVYDCMTDTKLWKDMVELINLTTKGDVQFDYV